MVNQPGQPSRRRTRFAFSALLATFALVLGGGAFATVATADDEPGTSAGAALADPTPTSPSANNPLSDQCGLNIALIVDRSGSTQNFNTAYKDAAKAFVNGLVGTPSHIGIVTFAASASLLSGYVDVSANPGNLNTLIDGLPTPTGNTNWQDALEKTTASFTSPVPDVAVFITDGNPTTHNGGGGSFYDLDNGIVAANALKSNGTTHITGVAVGADIDVDNIAKIAGPGVGFGGLDPDVQPSDTSTLVEDVKALATELCGGSVTIHKTVTTGPASSEPSDGWTFTSNRGPSGTTGSDGTGVTNIKLDPDQLGDNVFTETGLAGYTIQSVSCTNPATDVGASSFSVDVGKLDIVSCDVVNTPALGSIAISKVTTHGFGGPFGFNVSGPNSVDSNLSATTVAKDTATAAGTVSDLYPGVYTINEASMPEGWTLSGIDCGDATVAPHASATDPSISIVLHAGEHAACTYTDDEVPSDLAITKTASAPVAVNGGVDQQIDYTLTVDNNGPADAHADATVTDMLPAGATLVSVSPPAGVTCDSSAAPKITCTIPASDLEVADPPVVIGVRVTVPSGAGTIVNKTIVSSPDDPAPCTVTTDDITCTEPTDNYAQVSTDVPQVAADVVTNPPVAVSPASVEASNLAFTGARPTTLVLLGFTLVVGGMFALFLARRRNGGTAR
jgi:uncharacterized repeat protein (TIGR01451 family)